jgi:hypothetical protein
MLLNARRARRAATVFLAAAFGVPVFAADGVIASWMSGAGPSAKTYVFKTHDNRFIGNGDGPCDDPSTVFRVADGTVTDAGHVSFLRTCWSSIRSSRSAKRTSWSPRFWNRR